MALLKIMGHQYHTLSLLCCIHSIDHLGHESPPVRQFRHEVIRIEFYNMTASRCLSIISRVICGSGNRCLRLNELGYTNEGYYQSVSRYWTFVGDSNQANDGYHQATGCRHSHLNHISCEYNPKIPTSEVKRVNIVQVARICNFVSSSNSTANSNAPSRVTRNLKKIEWIESCVCQTLFGHVSMKILYFFWTRGM